jgi:hypothetical protein
VAWTVESAVTARPGVLYMKDSQAAPTSVRPVGSRVRAQRAHAAFGFEAAIEVTSPAKCLIRDKLCSQGTCKPIGE